MSEMHLGTSDLHADAQVVLFLHDHDYAGLMQFIDAQYGSRFMVEQTGASFEACIDWCAQNAGGIDNAKYVLLLLFDRYYRQLPSPVQSDLLDLAEELGFDTKPPDLDELKVLCRPRLKRRTTRAVSLIRTARMLLSMGLLRFSMTLVPKTGVEQWQPDPN